MKKILAMLLALVMVLSLAACGGEKAPEAAGNENAPAASVSPRFIIVSLVALKNLPSLK